MCEHMRFSTMFDHVFQPWDLRTVFVALILIETGPFFSFLFLPRPTMTPNDPLKCTWLNLISALDGSNPVKRSPDFSSCTKYPNHTTRSTRKKTGPNISSIIFFKSTIIHPYPSTNHHEIISLCEIWVSHPTSAIGFTMISSFSKRGWGSSMTDTSPASWGSDWPKSHRCHLMF